jgi:hypothetical protein
MSTGNFWLDQIKLDEIKSIVHVLIQDYVGEELDEDTVEEIEIRLKKRLDGYEYDADFEFDGETLSIFLVGYNAELLFRPGSHRLTENLFFT